jgi:mono/diheme cytochrome c family protein
MGEAIEMSLRHLAPGDISAMASYLQSVPAVESPSLPRIRVEAPVEVAAGHGASRGKQIFEGACASCHAWNGSGTVLLEAALMGSRAINDPSATNVVQMILAGTGHVESGRPFMPGFGAAYSDSEIAALSNYVTERFGSAKSHLSVKDVQGLRSLN